MGYEGGLDHHGVIGGDDGVAIGTAPSLGEGGSLVSHQAPIYGQGEESFRAVQRIIPARGELLHASRIGLSRVAHPSPQRPPPFGD
jgi:hypothetical protein